MQIISVSRGSQSAGKEFARQLATKLGYECISREDLLEEATRQRIPVGKLETAIVKPHSQSERLAIELEHFKALATSILCEKALDHPIVYHGRTGHLLLPGISHVLRIRVVIDMERRIETVMNQLHLSRKKAVQYIEAVEEDRRRWAKRFYNVDWDVFTLYDLVVNLSQVEAGNAAMAVCSIAQLPDFQPTPASTNALKDLLLASRARLALARDETTADLNVKVTAGHGVVYVTYSFLQAKKAGNIEAVLKTVPEARQIVATQAQTNVLWIQESFDTDDGAIADILSLANSWDAAVEIIKLTPGKDFKRLPVADEIARRGLESWRQTGIIDDEDELGSREPEDVSRAYDLLISNGRAGGKRVVEGSLKSLLNSIDRTVQYRLVVFDNVFLSKNPEARLRSTQEWSNTLTESLHTPVVTLKEIRAQYRFGLRQAIRLTAAALIAAVLVAVVFGYEEWIVDALQLKDTSWRVLSTACIVVFVPSFAYVYSTATGMLLRLIRLE